MPTYFMFGKYSAKAAKEISAKRTEEAIALVKKNDGELTAAYALLGEVDLVLIVELPDNEAAIKTSADLSRLLGISFHTAPAITAEKFDKLMG